MPLLKHFASIGLRSFHLVTVVFTLLGWAVPIPLVWKIHLVFVPATIGQWWLNEGTCILTNLENWLRGEVPDKSQQQGQFIKSLLGLCCQPLPSDETIKIGIYALMGTAWLLSALQLSRMMWS
ncbi:MAG: DUF2784 family protein [Cyanobacteriota bacterium]|nr:DUF2784 family protein [Cyanobacteriota bacterium]